MSTFTFKGANGDFITVQAETEAEGRKQVMKMRWGKPDANVPAYDRGEEYVGKGLDLVSFKF